MEHHSRKDIFKHSWLFSLAGLITRGVASPMQVFNYRGQKIRYIL